MRDKDKVATFTGDVHVVQGDTDLKCKVLVVFYEQEAGKAAGPAAPAAQPGPNGQSQIRRMEAKGGVVVTQKDGTATGDFGEFEMRNNTITLTGNVVITRNKNVTRGHKLVVDMTTGVSKMEGGRVDMLIDRSGDGQTQSPFPGQRPRTN